MQYRQAIQADIADRHTDWSDIKRPDPQRDPVDWRIEK